MRRQALSSNTLAILLIALSLAIHVVWMLYTRYTEEDAYITFRYARQLAMGNGFVYNMGERVYGTTTPLLTVLLALWLKFISGNIVRGANLINLLAATGIPIFTWSALKVLKRSGAEQCFTLAALLLSSKLIFMSTQGMEISLSIALMAGSWYTWVKGKTILAGLLCGLLLWTRIDTVFWLVILVLATWASSRRNAVELGMTAAITYLPWIVFAVFYFGSPIPHTITAKWVAYGMFNQRPYIDHLGLILKYLSPFREETVLQWLGTLIVLGVAGWGIWYNRTFREKAFTVLMIFVLFEISRLTITHATFFNRYFIPILWSTLILFGMGLGALWDRSRTSPAARVLFLSFSVILAIVQGMAGISLARSSAERQVFRYEASLEAMGLWLKNNTPAQSTVLLEPLGYVGYYSERNMIDEVGLVTPAITDLKLQQIGPEHYAAIFKPEYIIVHCQDDTRIPDATETGLSYRYVKTFDPLDFSSGAPDRNISPGLLVMRFGQRTGSVSTK